MDDFTLYGLIFMVVVGAAIGSYACAVIYRLPRGKTPFEQHPFCGRCNAPLKPIDLMPVISWLRTRGKCRYCGGAIPAVYLITEVTSLIVFVTYFLSFGMSEQFLLYAAFATFVIILAAIDWEHRFIASSIYGYALTCVLLVRTLTEQTIYGAIQTGFVMLVIMLTLFRLAGNKTDPFQRPWIWWFTLLGALSPFAYWKYLAALYVVKLLIPKRYRVLAYSGAALVLPLVVS